MELWIVTKVVSDKAGAARKSSRTFKTKDDAIAYVRSVAAFHDVMGYERLPAKDSDESVSFKKDDETAEYYMYTTDGFDVVPEMVTNTYRYDKDTYLEVMHDFENKIAAMYAYNPKFPDCKVCMMRASITETNISDSEILGLNMDDLDSRIEVIRDEVWSD